MTYLRGLLSKDISCLGYVIKCYIIMPNEEQMLKRRHLKKKICKRKSKEPGLTVAVLPFLTPMHAGRTAQCQTNSTPPGNATTVTPRLLVLCSMAMGLSAAGLPRETRDSQGTPVHSRRFQVRTQDVRSFPY